MESNQEKKSVEEIKDTHGKLEELHPKKSEDSSDGLEAIGLIRQVKADVVLMDVGIPGLNGIEANRQIIKDNSDIKVLALSGYSNKRFVTDMLKAGASGYVLKQCPFQELACAIRNAASNQMYLSPQISGTVVEGYIHRQVENDDSAYSILTPREREVLQLITEGKSTKAIAKELYVSSKTIDWHRSQLMKKLGVQSVAELVKYAINEGLTCAYA